MCESVWKQNEKNVNSPTLKKYPKFIWFLNCNIFSFKSKYHDAIKGQSRCPGLNFINILRTAFRRADPKGVKRYWWLYCIFYTFTLYTTSIKAAPKMLVKLAPVWHLFGTSWHGEQNQTILGSKILVHYSNGYKHAAKPQISVRSKFSSLNKSLKFLNTLTIKIYTWISFYYEIHHSVPSYEYFVLKHTIFKHYK